MGCDIHSIVEINKNGKWEVLRDRVFKYWDYMTSCPFSGRNYGVFGFLANVRNYSFIPYLTECRGYPSDFENYEENLGEHSLTWVSLKELLDFDYEQTFEDRRTTKQEAPNYWNGAADAGEGNGNIITFREFLGKQFFEDLEILKSLDHPNPENVRIVMGFDS